MATVSQSLSHRNSPFGMQMHSAEPEPVRILSISASAEDHAVLRRLLRGRSCRIESADTCEGALRRLRNCHASIVICNCTLPDGTWHNMLDYLNSCPSRPLFIVTSSLATAGLWGEVLNLGGFDVIAKPFDRREVRYVLGTAYLRVHARATGQALSLRESG